EVIGHLVNRFTAPASENEAKAAGVPGGVVVGGDAAAAVVGEVDSAVTESDVVPDRVASVGATAVAELGAVTVAGGAASVLVRDAVLEQRVRGVPQVYAVVRVLEAHDPPNDVAGAAVHLESVGAIAAIH